MERNGVDAQTAFEHLRAAARSSGRLLTVVADQDGLVTLAVLEPDPDVLGGVGGQVDHGQGANGQGSRQG